jgi:hypothetical protein
MPDGGADILRPVCSAGYASIVIRRWLVLVGKLSAYRRNCAPLAGKSTLNRLGRPVSHVLSRSNRWSIPKVSPWHPSDELTGIEKVRELAFSGRACSVHESTRV